MTKKLWLAVVFACLIVSWSLAQAQNSIVVYPDPVEFGIVDLGAVGYPLTVYVSNPTTNSLQITAMTIVGPNRSDFAFYNGDCVGTIAADQSCQMLMTMTPSAIGNRIAGLKISVAGTATPISIPLQGSGGNPLPNITTLSPPSGYQGSSGVKLTINGSGFLTTSVAFWNSSQLPTTYVNSTQLTAQLPASDLASYGSYQIFVTNPAPGGGTGQGVDFQVIALNPILQSVFPSSMVSGTAATSIVIDGQNFMTGATALWNGKPLSTTYVNSNQLQAQLNASELARASIAQLSVSNPTPGGVSSSLVFNVTYPAKVLTLDLPANDLVWDPYARRIYASLPSSYGVNGNTIAVINPYNGAINSFHFAGSEPTKLALSSDGKYLYTGLNGNGSVQRFVLPGFVPDITVSLDTNSAAMSAGGLAVSPGDPHTFAVIATGGCCNSGGALDFFQDTQLLAGRITSPQFTDMAFATPTTLYGYSNDQVSQVTVSSTGGKLGTQWSNLVQGLDILYDAGLIYSSNGQVFNPSTALLTGALDVSGSGCCSSVQVLPDAAINRAFALGTTPFFNAFGITSYNLSQFTPVAVTNLAQLNGNNTSTFLRWGSSGLAFISLPGCCNSSPPQIVLVQSGAMLLTSGVGSNPKPTLASVTPNTATHGSGNLILTLQGTGFVPGSTVTWNGLQLTVEYISATQLNAYVSGADIASPGTASVVVINSLPAGGSSSPSTFTIN